MLDVEAEHVTDELFFQVALMQNTPMLIYDYAREWPATRKWIDKNYLVEKAGISFVDVNTYATHPWKVLSKKQREKEEERLHQLEVEEEEVKEEDSEESEVDRKKKEQSFSSIITAASKSAKNSDGLFTQHTTNPIVQNMALEDAINKIKNSKQTFEESISFIAFENIVALQGPLKKDYDKPIVENFLGYRGAMLTIWPKFERKPFSIPGETFHCVIDGTEKVRMISSVFSQNLYQNVYEELDPFDLPKDLDLFKINEKKYPLLNEVR